MNSMQKKLLMIKVCCILLVVLSAILVSAILFGSTSYDSTFFIALSVSFSFLIFSLLFYRISR